MGDLLLLCPPGSLRPIQPRPCRAPPSGEWRCVGSSGAERRMGPCQGAQTGGPDFRGTQTEGGRRKMCCRVRKKAYGRGSGAGLAGGGPPEHGRFPCLRVMGMPGVLPTGASVGSKHQTVYAHCLWVERPLTEVSFAKQCHLHQGLEASCLRMRWRSQIG